MIDSSQRESARRSEAGWAARIGPTEATAVILVLLVLSISSFQVLIWRPYSAGMSHIGVTFQEHYDRDIDDFRLGFEPTFREILNPMQAWKRSGPTLWWVIWATGLYLWWWYGKRAEGRRGSKATKILSLVPLLVAFIGAPYEMRMACSALASQGLSRADLMGMGIGESFCASILALYTTLGLWILLGIDGRRGRQKAGRLDGGQSDEEESVPGGELDKGER